jgi:hypothetical protein
MLCPSPPLRQGFKTSLILLDFLFLASTDRHSEYGWVPVPPPENHFRQLDQPLILLEDVPDHGNPVFPGRYLY